MAEKSSKNIIDATEDFFKKAPALPTNFKEGLIQYTPVLVLIFGILGILVGLAGTGILTIFSPLALVFGVQGYGSSIISGWTLIIASALLLASYSGIKAKKLSGWNLLFWSEAVNVVGSVVGGSIVNAIVGALIGFYLLFQIKSYYK